MFFFTLTNKKYFFILLPEFPFDFVFFIPLRDVDENCPLATVIIDQHDQLDKEDTELIHSMLNRRTKHKVLLLLDGYDEYNPGTNTDIDRCIAKTVGKCFIILTSRPQDGKDFTKSIRNKMQGEVVITGFSDENIKKCCSLYLGSDYERKRLLNEVTKYSTPHTHLAELGDLLDDDNLSEEDDLSEKDDSCLPYEPDLDNYSGLSELLRIPIMLLMLCVLYKESSHKSLPERRTKIYEELYELVMDRTTLKPNNFGCESSKVENIHEMLETLGKFAWEALKGDVKQLLLNKVSFNRGCILR